MQIEEEALAFRLKSFVYEFTITSQLLEGIIGLYDPSQVSPQAKAMLRLLQITDKTLNLQRAATIEDTLGSILQVIVGKLKMEEPLGWLAAGEFDQFSLYCAQMQNNEFRTVLQWSFGLYPPISEIQKTPSIFLSNNGGPLGNPQWLFSRKALKDYYRIKSAKMSGLIKKIYMFLLSDRELLDGWKQPFKLLWGELYLLYNAILLQPHLNSARISTDNEVITWSRPMINDVLSRIRQSALSLEEKMLLYLILTILSMCKGWSEEFQGSWFQEAFSAFNLGYNGLPEWQNLMAFLFFTIISNKLKLPTIKQQCNRHFKTLLNNNHYCIDKLAPYLYFLLNQEDLLKVIHEHRLEWHWRIPLPQNMKKRIAEYLIKKGVLQKANIEFMEPKDLRKYLFQSATILEDPRLGQNLMANLYHLQPEVLKHLKYFEIDQGQALASCNLFIHLWTKYYQILQEQIAETSILNSILSTHTKMHKNLNFLLLPTDCPNALFNILNIIAKTYRAMMQDPAYLSSDLLNSHREFEENILPNFLKKLSMDQRADFQREWEWFSSPQALAIIEE